jgi:hypothetical protein
MRKTEQEMRTVKSFTRNISKNLRASEDNIRAIHLYMRIFYTIIRHICLNKRILILKVRIYL